jgi:hypothetical protein
MKLIKVESNDAAKVEFLTFGNASATHPTINNSGIIRINLPGKELDVSKAENLIINIKGAIKYAKTGKF